MRFQRIPKKNNSYTSKMLFTADHAQKKAVLTLQQTPNDTSNFIELNSPGKTGGNLFNVDKLGNVNLSVNTASFNMNYAPIVNIGTSTFNSPITTVGGINATGGINMSGASIGSATAYGFYSGGQWQDTAGGTTFISSSSGYLFNIGIYGSNSVTTQNNTLDDGSGNMFSNGFFLNTGTVGGLQCGFIPDGGGIPLADFGINVAQFGTPDSGYSGGIFRLDMRGDYPFFQLLYAPTGDTFTGDQIAPLVITNPNTSGIMPSVMIGWPGNGSDNSGTGNGENLQVYGNTYIGGTLAIVSSFESSYGDFAVDAFGNITTSNTDGGGNLTLGSGCSILLYSPYGAGPSTINVNSANNIAINASGGVDFSGSAGTINFGNNIATSTNSITASSFIGGTFVADSTVKSFSSVQLYSALNNGGF